MRMKNFKTLDNLTGWAIFLIATFVYLLTIEPTSSLWDCGEFIATSYKLEVGHPPGASIFMLIARTFTLFAPSTEHVALMVNAMSALCSAFCILFLFWSITHLARRIYVKNGEVETDSTKTIIILGAGAVGALAYMFTDTFWFSAVEGEVYAMSSLFTAIVFWAILKWEEEADESYANRWLVLLAYLMGLSIGVHLLNLLALPAIIFVYYFKKYEITPKGIAVTFGVSMFMLGVIVFGIIPGVPKIAAYVELLFVNQFGLPYNSGLAFYTFALIGLLGYFCYRTLQKKKILLNTIFLCVTMIVLGYFSLAAILIRSSANPPINENNPSNVFSLLSYLNREQYGDRPLFSGSSFASPLAPYSKPADIIKKNTIYEQKNGRYETREIFAGYRLDPNYNMLFPRLYSTQPGHFEQYVQWAGMKNIAKNKDGAYTRKPTTLENWRYMFNYQFGWMYARYFMWNFVGRQNDIQGNGEPMYGNWISGIDFIDQAILGIDYDKAPDYLRENKGRNRYFFIPLLLGLIGLLFHYKYDKKNFAVVMLLFIFTGIAIAFYLNMPPSQPRERDYVFAGSFYAFAIWIGLSVLAFFELFKEEKHKKIGAVLSIGLGLTAPVILGAQNWDDHDRSNRYTARDIAYNYLNTCGDNAILFTFGDNDTFPLWYLQEVEDGRTDVRVINMSLLGMDWYIDQMRNRVYLSAPVPFSLPKEIYAPGINDFISVVEAVKDTLTAKQVIDFIANPASKDKRTGDNYIPCRNIKIPVDKAAVLRHGIVPLKDSALIEDYIYLQFTKGAIMKSELMVLDLLANYKWDRPIYSVSAAGDINFNQAPYMQYEGFAYKLVPIRKTDNKDRYDLGSINTDILYDNLMNKYRWGNMEKPGVLVDYHNMVSLNMTLNVRNSFLRLSKQLMSEGKTTEAVAVLDRAMELTPRNPFFYNVSFPLHEFALIGIIETYVEANQMEKAKELLLGFMEETAQNLNMYASLGKKGQQELEYNLYYLQMLNDITEKHNMPKEGEQIRQLFSTLVGR